MHWMLLVLLHSDINPESKKPIESFFATQTECAAALKKANDDGHYEAQCIEGKWGQ